MTIKIQMKKYVLSINLCKKTQWFEQSNFIQIAKEYYDNHKQIGFAEIIFKAF